MNVMYYDYMKQLSMESQIQPPMGSLFEFSGDIVVNVGIVRLSVTLGSLGAQAKKMVEFVVIHMPNNIASMLSWDIQPRTNFKSSCPPII